MCLVSIGMGCDFWREEVLSFGIHAYKCGFREGFAFFGSFVRISKSQTCVPTSSLFLLTSFKKMYV